MSAVRAYPTSAFALRELAPPDVHRRLKLALRAQVGPRFLDAGLECHDAIGLQADVALALDGEAEDVGGHVATGSEHTRPADV
jgi:hypothetical protein